MNRPEGGCGFTWPLVDPNEEDQRNLIAHACRRDPEHAGEHRCHCGSRPPRPPRPEPTDDMLMAIINAWVEPGRVHVPGCVLQDLDSYCLDCHVTASNALDEMKRRRDA